jgi:septal ring factor EnvC (AmiA/AmiB activator)
MQLSDNELNEIQTAAYDDRLTARDTRQDMRRLLKHIEELNTKISELTLDLQDEARSNSELSVQVHTMAETLKSLGGRVGHYATVNPTYRLFLDSVREEIEAALSSVACDEGVADAAA